MAERGGTAVRERPILFSGEMVRALLDGRKTQTRRVVTDKTSRGNYRASELLLDDPRTFVDPGPSPAGNPGPYLHAYLNCPVICARLGWEPHDCDPAIMERLYPWVFRGDRLWVRESGNWSRTDGVRYKADGVPNWNLREPWKSAIHMPRWASRITLEITDVRVERVQDISDSDVEEEGIEGSCYGFCVTERCWRGAFDDLSASDGYCPTCGGKDFLSEVPSDLYANLWDSLNAARGYSWDSNPFVWVLSFDVIRGAPAPEQAHAALDALRVIVGVGDGT